MVLVDLRANRPPSLDTLLPTAVLGHRGYQMPQAYASTAALCNPEPRIYAEPLSEWGGWGVMCSISNIKMFLIWVSQYTNDYFLTVIFICEKVYCFLKKKSILTSFLSTWRKNCKTEVWDKPLPETNGWSQSSLCWLKKHVKSESASLTAPRHDDNGGPGKHRYCLKIQSLSF